MQLESKTAFASPRCAALWIAAGLLMAGGCVAVADNPVQVSLNEDFYLKVGQSAVVGEADIEIGFTGVTSDSRCGKGETCVWEGNATVKIWLSAAGGPKEERELNTAARMVSAADYANFNVGLVALHPPAISGQAIEPDQYVATLRVGRGMSGGQVVY